MSVEAFLAKQHKKVAELFEAQALGLRIRWNLTRADDAEAEALKVRAEMFEEAAKVYMASHDDLLGLTAAPATDTASSMKFDDIKASCNFLRTQIKDIGDGVKDLKDNAVATASSSSSEQLLNIDTGEAVANIQLAFRHLEDARMRLGKCIQAIDGGKSVYDAGQQGQA